MRLCFLFSFLFCYYLIDAQPIRVSILGREIYTTRPDQFRFDVFTDGSASRQRNLYEFLSNLNTLPIEYSIDSSKMPPTVYLGHKKYEIYTSTIEQAVILQQEAEMYNFNGEIIYGYSPIPPESHDSLAILAFNDAKRRAQIMANYLGKKKIKVVSIDDFVETYLFYFDYKLTLIQGKEFISQFNQLLSLLSSVNPLESQNEERSGQYALWVTFELSP